MVNIHQHNAQLLTGICPVRGSDPGGDSRRQCSHHDALVPGWHAAPLDKDRIYEKIRIGFMKNAEAELTQPAMEKKEKAIAARAASAPCKAPLPIFVRCHWFARKQKATNHRKDKKPKREQSRSVLLLPAVRARTSAARP